MSAYPKVHVQCDANSFKPTPSIFHALQPSRASEFARPDVSDPSPDRSPPAPGQRCATWPWSTPRTRPGSVWVGFPSLTFASVAANLPYMIHVHWLLGYPFRKSFSLRDVFISCLLINHYKKCIVWIIFIEDEKFSMFGFQKEIEELRINLPCFVQEQQDAIGESYAMF